MKNKITIINKCCCCGGDVKASYQDGEEMNKCMAESCDVCVKCYKAGCLTMSGEICNVTGKTQVQLITKTS